MSLIMKPCPAADSNPRPPNFKMPANACDTHAHIFGPADRYPWSAIRAYTPPDALPAEYEHLHRVLGVTRGVLTQPSVYGTDNRAMMDYAAVNKDHIRAVVAVDKMISDQDLEHLHSLGARGIRVNIADKAVNTFANFAELCHMADRVKAMSWHIEFLMHSHQLDDHLLDIKTLPVEASFGHFGYMPARLGVDHPSFRAFLDLLETGRIWVKISGSYRVTAMQHTPYTDVTPFARVLVQRRPDRILWGTDWPHPICPIPMPNDGDLLDQVADWLPDEATRNRILVDNPTTLYGF
jgi:2-pyrone-4,6-dicarboxylate lactonase